MFKRLRNTWLNWRFYRAEARHARRLDYELELTRHSGEPSALRRRRKFNTFMRNWRWNLSPFFWLWVKSFNTAARQIDPMQEMHKLSDEVGLNNLARWYRAGYTPDQAIYDNMTIYQMGKSINMRIDGRDRRGGASIEEWGKTGVATRARNHWHALASQAQVGREKRANNTLREWEMLHGRPLQIGIPVLIVSGHNPKSGTISNAFIPKDEERWMYEVKPEDGSDPVHARAIDLWWEGRPQ